VGRVRGGQRTVAAIDAIDTGMRGGPDPEVVDSTTFPITIDDEASTGESTMSSWSTDELRKIAATDDLHISPFRGDGKTYGTPTWMWSVAVDDALDVRAYNGKNSRWCQAALRQKAGRVTAAGITKEVSFESVNGAIHDPIDDAYRAKDKGSPSLSPMIGTRACSATVNVMPRDGNA
jgi:hypothetical protein